MKAESVRIEGSTLEELYLRYADGAFRLAFLISGNRQVAEDLTQEAFVRIAGRLLHLRNRVEFEWYLRRTVVNLANSNFRRSWVERRYVQAQASMLATLGCAHRTRRRPPANRCYKPSWTFRGASAPPSHSASTRTYPEAETAAIMGCSPGTVKSLVAKGKDNLRELLGGGQDG